MKLGNKEIEKEGKEHFLILEAGTNFYETADILGISIIDAAKKMALEAKDAGADAIKFQTFKAEKLASEKYAKEQFQYMSRRDTLDYGDYIEIESYCKSIGIEFMTTLFDLDGVRIIGPYLNIFKIASPDITNTTLIKKIIEFEKPIIISTGASYEKEIYDKACFIKPEKLIIMHCIASYPAKEEELNLSYIRTLNKNYPNNVIGYSDHFYSRNCWDGMYKYTNITPLITAFILGANVIEKHFTLTPEVNSSDHYHSLDKPGVISFLKKLEKVKKSIYGIIKKERFPLASEDDLYMLQKIFLKVK